MLWKYEGIYSSVLLEVFFLFTWSFFNMLLLCDSLHSKLMQMTDTRSRLHLQYRPRWCGPGCAAQAQGKQVMSSQQLCTQCGSSEFPGCHGLCVLVCHIYNLHLHKLPYRRNDRAKHMTYQFQPLTLKTASTLTLTISKVQNFKIKPMFSVMPAQVPEV